MPPFRNSFISRLAARSALWIGVLLSCSIGGVFYLFAANSVEKDARERFVGVARGVQITISARIKSYTDVLRGARTLFNTSEKLSGAQFHDYVEGLDLANNFPGIETFNFLRSLTDAERDDWEREQREDMRRYAPNAAPFRITPPGRRASYAVFQFIEPSANSAVPLGFDLSANRRVADSISNLRDSGEMITSGSPVPYISVPGNVGLALRMPIYRKDMPVATRVERRLAHLGSIGLAFRMRNLLDGVLENLPIRHVHMTLVDNPRTPVAAPPVLLFDSDYRDGKRALAPAPANSFAAALPINYHGRSWTATLRVGRGDLYTGFEEYLPWAAMLVGLCGAGLLFALFYTLSSSRQRAVQLARGMTSELRESQTKLEQTHDTLRRLAAHADQIKEGERKRIAREIHDDLGQNLLALRIEADMLSTRTRTGHPRLHARARMTLQQIDATIKSVRQIINDLRPNVLDLGLGAAAEWQVAEFTRRSGIACELVDELNDMAVNDHCATAYFRILQESLSNITRHAQARHVRVRLACAHGQLRMEVRDDGVGLHAGGAAKPGSFGLIGIMERIHILGGSCTVLSAAEGGTVVSVSVPLTAGAPGTPGTARRQSALA